MFTSMWAKIKSNLNTNINEYKIRCRREHVKFTTAYLKAMDQRQDIIKDFFQTSLYCLT